MNAAHDYYNQEEALVIILGFWAAQIGYLVSELLSVYPSTLSALLEVVSQ